MRSDLRFLAAAFPLTSLYVGASAHAGQVLFDPPSATIDRTLGQNTATFEMSVDSQVVADIWYFNMVVGSDTLLVQSWSGYPPWNAFCDPGPCPVPAPTSPPVYPSDLAYGVLVFAGSPLSVGRLTVRVPFALSPGSYEVVVDANRDGNHSVLYGSVGEEQVLDPLFGRAIVNVVPEPAAITLLALAAAAALARRQRRIRS